MSKVKIQGNASGTGVLTVTAPNTSTDRTITLPDSTGTLATTADVPAGISSSADATAITIDSNENVGFGVTPETWDSRKALQIGGNGALAASPSAGSGGYIQLLQNAYTDGTWKYISTDEAARLRSQDGQWNFDVAASGTADSAITWATKATIDTDGLKFGTDTAAANALDDYEEGTWTPTIVNGGTISTVNAAVYTKVGNVVSFQLYANNISITNNGSTFEIGGLPFQPMNSPNTYAGGEVGYVGGFNWSQYAPAFLVNPGGSKVYWQRLNGSGATVLQSQVAALTVIILSGVYHTNS